ncbi:MAG: Holliday junction branch migration protein RuvA [Lachnospiraceae bacterium]|nr:Holliday junction branch migration protein RuvA [Lachnospiraceae bacterium]
MLSAIRGILVHIDENTAELDVGGVTFEVNVPSTLFVSRPENGSELQLYTYLSVREDDLSLFGFQTREERSLFKMLITVSGIGPKGALQVLSTLRPNDLVAAILSEDAKSIARAPGIGQKTAQKVVLELRDKVSGMPVSDLSSISGTAKTVAYAENDTKHDVILALTELGFSGSEAYKAVAQLPDDLDASKMLNLALKSIAR